MILSEYSYEILELLRKELTDDFFIDIRLITEVIVAQREVAVYNAINKGNSGGATSAGYDGGWEAYVQTTDPFTLSLQNCTENDPCKDAYAIWKSDEEFPMPIMMGRRPAILRVLPTNCDFKSDILFSSHDRMRFTGHGRANPYRRIASLRYDHFWVGRKTEDATAEEATITLIVDGIFADPREVPGFDETTDEFPIGKNWPYMMEAVLGVLRIKMSGTEDVVNDARDYVGDAPK